jgi:hypothetical protein
MTDCLGGRFGQYAELLLPCQDTIACSMTDSRVTAVRRPFWLACGTAAGAEPRGRIEPAPSSRTNCEVI